MLSLIFLHMIKIESFMKKGRKRARWYKLIFNHFIMWYLACGQYTSILYSSIYTINTLVWMEFNIRLFLLSLSSFIHHHFHVDWLKGKRAYRLIRLNLILLLAQRFYFILLRFFFLSCHLCFQLCLCINCNLLKQLNRSKKKKTEKRRPRTLNGSRHINVQSNSKSFHRFHQ